MVVTVRGKWDFADTYNEFKAILDYLHVPLEERGRSVRDVMMKAEVK